MSFGNYVLECKKCNATFFQKQIGNREYFESIELNPCPECGNWEGLDGKTYWFYESEQEYENYSRMSEILIEEGEKK